MSRTWIALLPSLVVAAGILGGTAVSARVPDDLVLAGPLVLASTTVVSGLLARRLGVGGGSVASAFGLGAIVLLTGAILALGDPARVSSMMPILGACAAVPLISGPRCCLLRARAPAGSDG